MPEHIVKIASFSHVIDAYLVKTRLDWDGVECFVFDEDIVAVNWLCSLAIGGVKLVARESDLQRALEIVHREPEEPDFLDIIGESADWPVCPRCGSRRVGYERFKKPLVYVAWLLLSFPLPFFKRKWDCRACGYEWKKE